MKKSLILITLLLLTSCGNQVKEEKQVSVNTENEVNTGIINNVNISTGVVNTGVILNEKKEEKVDSLVENKVNFSDDEIKDILEKINKNKNISSIIKSDYIIEDISKGKTIQEIKNDGINPKEIQDIVLNIKLDNKIKISNIKNGKFKIIKDNSLNNENKLIYNKYRIGKCNLEENINECFDSYISGEILDKNGKFFSISKPYQDTFSFKIYKVDDIFKIQNNEIDYGNLISITKDTIGNCSILLNGLYIFCDSIYDGIIIYNLEKRTNYHINDSILKYFIDDKYLYGISNEFETKDKYLYVFNINQDFEKVFSKKLK